MPFGSLAPSIIPLNYLLPALYPLV
jgi:hypothetical protein